jgi:polyphosphate:AMP phosphotransferase
MFEAAELGRTVSKQEFDEEEPKLHAELLALQHRLGTTDCPVIIIVSGVEGAGKGEVVDVLNKWLDVRGIETHAFWEQTDEERERPWFWRFWRTLPARGRIGIMFGSWYTQPIIDRVIGITSSSEFDTQIRHINDFEQALCEDGAVILKFWFHLSKKDQKRRLKEEKKGKGGKISPLTKKFSKRYDQFVQVSERTIRLSDIGDCPWHIIEATDRRYRNLSVGRIVRNALTEQLDHPPNRIERAPFQSPSALGNETILNHVDLSQTIDTDSYQKQLRDYQRQLYDLSWQLKKRGINFVAVFEGWDAAGKGGAIRRVTQSMDARLYRVISIAAPSDEERAHHYLWRFWRHVPRKGYGTIYDRSWYGRVLVERVEGFAGEAEWGRAYQEINDFEEHLTNHGTVLLKFWLHIDKEEQFRRFEERQATPWKQHKITDEDWRNRDRWEAYEAAVNEMVVRTSTEYAPWTLVPANDKKVARLTVLKTFCTRLNRALKN